jgi:hypothetical protein
MIIASEKKAFIKKISGGLHILMSCSYKADEIGTSPDCPIEEFIREDFIVHANTVANGERYWFDDGKFVNAVDLMSDEDLVVLLKYFDNVDMYLKRVYHEACLSFESMSDEDMKFASLIDNGHLITFEHLINHE